MADAQEGTLPPDGERREAERAKKRSATASEKRRPAAARKRATPGVAAHRPRAPKAGRKAGGDLPVKPQVKGAGKRVGAPVVESEEKGEKPEKPGKREAKQDAKEAKRAKRAETAKRDQATYDRRSGDLTRELDMLNAALNDMVDSYRLRIDAALLQLLRATRGEAHGDAAPVRLSPQATQKMLGLISGVTLKPRKGRVKDFDRLQELVEELVELLPDGDEAAT